MSTPTLRQLYEAAYPTYTEAERRAARARIEAEKAKFIMVDFGDGRGAVRWMTGVVDLRDHEIAYGPSIKCSWVSDPQPIARRIRGAS